MVRTEIRGVDVQQAFRIISDDSYRAKTITMQEITKTNMVYTGWGSANYADISYERVSVLISRLPFRSSSREQVGVPLDTDEFLYSSRKIEFLKPRYKRMSGHSLLDKNYDSLKPLSLSLSLKRSLH